MSQATSPRWKWILLLGGAGFAAGFFGPLAFSPESNQGPLVGIFITGPLGALLGAILFAACSALHVSAVSQWRILIGCCVAFGLSSLGFVYRDPAHYGDIVEVRIDRCATPEEKTREIQTQWKERMANVTWSKPRPGWENEVSAAMKTQRGAIVDATVLRDRVVLEHRNFWNRGKLETQDGDIHSESRSYYQPAGLCALYPIGSRSTYLARYDFDYFAQAPEEWPPKEALRLINLPRLEPVPASLAGK